MSPTAWVDDPTIGDDTILWRRINPADIVVEPATGTVRASTGAYRTAEMSVHIASKTTVEPVLANYPGFRLTGFTAGSARRAGCIVVRDPLPEDSSHALVCQPDDHTRSLSKKQAKAIRDAADWIVGP